MQTMKRGLAVVLLIVIASCGGNSLLSSFRVALITSGPLVNSLVETGAIPQSKASAIIADFDAGAQCGVTLQQAFKAVPDSLPEAERAARKLTASSQALTCFREIIAHGNFALHPRLQKAATIAEGILASLVLFYSDGGPQRAVAAEAASVEARNEDELEQRLEAKMKELERAMKP